MSWMKPPGVAMSGDITASDLDAESSTDGHVLTSDGAGNVAWEAVPGGGGGEANTASNVGTDGVGVWYQKSGVDLEFRHIAPASTKVTVALNGQDIDLDVAEANLTITESQISDLQSYITGITAESVGSLSDVNVTTPAARHGLMYDGVDSWDNRLLVEADISDLQSYLTAETNDLSASVTWANVPNANITQASVTQHQTALSITESQISDLAHFGGTVNDLSDIANTTPADKHVLVYDGVTDNRYENRLLVEADISDLQAYLTSETSHADVVVDGDIGSTVQAWSAVLDATTASFTTADETKLDGVEALADVTDTTNVTAAGALMDSEVDADIKTLVLPASTTISAFGATLVDDADAGTARTTLNVDVAGTDNSTAVTLAGQDYLTLSTQQITANKINIDDLADGTDGELITWSATGVPATVTVGTSGHVLTSNGVGAAPTFQAASGGGGINEYMYPVWAEENAALGASNTYEWAFGNGANTPNDGGMTVYVPTGWTCEVVAMSLRVGSGTATVELVKNGTVQGTACRVVLSSGQSATDEMGTPLALANNDYINFRTTSSSGTSGPCVVTAWIKMTET